ncbi:MAG: hypothetical protein ACRDWI_11655 [Jiangellaceae bacterium]
MRRTQLALYAIGTGVIAYGCVGLFTADQGPSPLAWARFWLGGLLAHDLVVAPAVVLLGVLVARLVPGRPRPYVQAGLAISAMLSVAALPFVLGRGRAEGEPSALPLDYGRGLLITLAAVWGVVAVVALLSRSRRPKFDRDDDGATADP